MIVTSIGVCVDDSGAQPPAVAWVLVLVAVVLGLILLARVNRELAKVLGWTLVGLIVASLVLSGLAELVSSCD